MLLVTALVSASSRGDEPKLLRGDRHLGAAKTQTWGRRYMNLSVPLSLSVYIYIYMYIYIYNYEYYILS